MGVLYLGVMLAMGLWGMSTVQMYYYYNNYLRDPMWIKLLYANSAFLDVIVDTLLIEVLFNGLIVFLVQAFFLLRVWRLSQKNIPVIVVLGGLILASLALSIVYTVRALEIRVFSRLTEIYALNRSINVINAVTDVALAAALIYLLQQSRTGFKRSNHIINRLIFFSLNTGLLTSIDAIVTLIMNTVYGSTFLYILFFLNISRLYTNSFMATLNSRKAFRGLDDSIDGESFSLSQSRYRARTVDVETPAGLKASNRTHALSVKVNTETVMTQDQDESTVKHGTPAESLNDISYHYDDSKPTSYSIQ
ncbi:hypothetical protein A7U60_g5673 [Sanghuangporus baumii]|uniref:DUF6534 domain-containing protein n=1 Tax=Sanghuangporus baumii TaxID=108892 RepID=A0A9Q5HWB9_SANBA|nr:hypothetical protein A7U60_g5673 [Sanghuangporus baumii]